MSSARVYGLNVVGNSGGQELVVCPWHDDHKPSAWFNPAKELFYCAVCNLGLNGWQLAKRMGIEIEEIEFGRQDEEPGEYDLVEEAFDTSVMFGANIYHDYFRERGICTGVIGHYGVQWSDAYDAAVLPITSIMGKAIGACYRYRNPEITGTRYKKFGEQTPVWPLHHLCFKKEGTGLIVCEGAWSAMRICSFMFKNHGVYANTVALLGAKANRSITDTLAPFQCIFLYDNDLAGRTACKRMRELSPLSLCYTLPQAPDDMNDNEIHAMLLKLDRKVREHEGRLGEIEMAEGQRES